MSICIHKVLRMALLLQYNDAGAALQVSLDLFLCLLSFQIKCMCVRGLNILNNAALQTHTFSGFQPPPKLSERTRKKKNKLRSKSCSENTSVRRLYWEDFLMWTWKLHADENKQRARRCCCNYRGLLWMIYGTLKWNSPDQIREHVVGWLLRLKHLHTDSHQDTECCYSVSVCVCVSISHWLTS